MENKNKITLEENDFQFNIEFSENDDTLFIEAHHTEEFLFWSKTLSAEVSSESSNQQFTLQYTPGDIFDILKKYQDETLDENIEITFPEKIKPMKQVS